LEWECDNVTGWKIKVDRSVKGYCNTSYAEYNKTENATKCKDFICDPFSNKHDNSWGDGGCYFKEKEGCSFQCTDEIDNGCLQQADENVNSNTHCMFDYCYVKVEGEGESQTFKPICASEVAMASVENCMDENSNSAKEAMKRNEEDPTVCFTPVCLFGKCTVEAVEKGADMIATKCMEPRCFQNEDGSWDWKMTPTVIKNTCISDACFSKVCDDALGCVATDNCTVQTNECYSYSCEKDENGDRVCAMKNLTKDFLDLECMHEVCEGGTKKKTYYTECVSEDKCMKGTCMKGYCEFSHTKAPGNDLCVDYTCDPKTGNWSMAPHCDDGLFCTIDECWNYVTSVECHHKNVDCGSRLNMDGYECFIPACKENPTNKTYRCMRKLLSNAYIDICGKCIRNVPDEDDSEQSENNRVTCTGAPPKPIMVETLAAATIGLIIIAAIVAGAAITTSTVIGTKTLIDRVRAANNQSAVSNPLYEGADTELQNPTYGNDR